MIRYPLPFAWPRSVDLAGLAESFGRFALDKPHEWPARWRRIYAPVYPLGFIVRMTARVLLWTCFLIPWGIVTGMRDHADSLRNGKSPG